LYRNIQRQPGHAHRGARMAPVLAEDLHHQIGEAVDHLWLGAEAFGRIDHAEDLDDALDLVEAPEKGPRRPQKLDTDLPGNLVAVLDGQIAADLAAHGGAAVPFGAMAREEQEVPDPDARDVVPQRLGRRRQADAELSNPRFSTHGTPPDLARVEGP